MRIIRYFLIGFILLIGILFAGLNATSVDINLYFHVYHLPLSLLLVLILGVGLFMGFLFGRFKHFCSNRHSHERDV